MGSIYKVNDTTSHKIELKKGLENLKTHFINNGYPRSLVDEKIKEIKILHQNQKKSIGKLR